MKTKASITLSSDVLERVDRSLGPESSRSGFIEMVLRHYFHECARREAQALEIERINAAAEVLNRESQDTLDYQASE